ncbi:CLUMA_CG000953, isoform A [Clunio marinus]|uniref:CLUMA_CG000953, isoform A n=1 Tax=Clunio marinus TaxID=568069 RepID=A0A1J1HGJ7_9DIPT|nr:CLUMA_CG000953, isoform A [Clunio marinus]
MMKIFVKILLVSLISNGETKSIPIKNSDISCIARYLIENNVLSETEIKEKIVDSADNCSDKIQLANKEFYRQLSRKTSGDKQIDSCAIATLKQHNATNFIFKEILTFHLDESKELRVLKDLKTLKERLFNTAEVICRHQDIFAPNINEKFDNLAENNVDINDIYEFNEIKFCVRKQIVENGVIDINENKVDISPRNIEKEDLEELDCKEVVDDLYNTMNRDIKEIIEGSPVERYVKTSCVVRKAENFNFLEKMFSFVFLIHSDLSNQNKNLLRNRADQMEPSVARYMLECVNLY